MSILDDFNKEKEKNVAVELRQKPDAIYRTVTWIAILGWISAIAAFVLLDRAKPLSSNFLTRLLDITVTSRWNTSMLRWAYGAIMGSLVASAAGLILSTSRKRRKTDRYSKLLITLAIVSVILMALFLIRYAVHL